jgi:hypothetical protein
MTVDDKDAIYPHLERARTAMGAATGKNGSYSEISVSEWVKFYQVERQTHRDLRTTFYCVFYRTEPQHPSQMAMTTFQDVGNEMWPGEIDTPAKLHDYVALAREKFGPRFHVMRMNEINAYDRARKDLGFDLILAEMVRQNIAPSNDNPWIQERFAAIYDRFAQRQEGQP